MIQRLVGMSSLSFSFPNIILKPKHGLQPCRSALGPCCVFNTGRTHVYLHYGQNVQPTQTDSPSLSSLPNPPNPSSTLLYTLVVIKLLFLMYPCKIFFSAKYPFKGICSYWTFYYIAILIYFILIRGYSDSVHFIFDLFITNIKTTQTYL